MNIWIYNSLTRSLRLNKVEIPKPNQGELLIKVKACGICGSDLHLFRKRASIRLFARSFIDSLIKSSIGEKILGHEISGIVVDSKDEKFNIGESCCFS
jgi:threonine dehydrogenase-like Zn-dependent dehydrogenase